MKMKLSYDLIQKQPGVVSTRYKIIYRIQMYNRFFVDLIFFKCFENFQQKKTHNKLHKVCIKLIAVSRSFRILRILVDFHRNYIFLVKTCSLFYAVIGCLCARVVFVSV